MQNFLLSVLACGALAGIYVTDAADPPGPSCSSFNVKSAVNGLKKKLFCGYDPQVRPVKDRRTATNVSIVASPTSLTMDEDKNLLKIQQWGFWGWRDEFLHWDNETYNNLSMIYVTTEEIWSPNIELFTTANMKARESQLAPSTPCDLKNDGTVECWPLITNTARCNADIALWPFDTQNCSLTMGSWTRTAAEVNLSLAEKGISAQSYTKSPLWELLSLTAEKKEASAANATYHVLIYNFVLKRHAGSDTVALVIPALMLAVFTLVAFWIEPGASERLCITCLNIVCHCLFLQYLGFNLPSNGRDKCPLIVLFYRDSLLMTGISLIITLMVRRLEEASSAPPSWVTAVVNGVLTTLPGQLLILSGADSQPKLVADDAEGHVVSSAESNRNVWQMFASFANFFVFLVYSLTLAGLLLAFVV